MAKPKTMLPEPQVIANAQVRYQVEVLARAVLRVAARSYAAEAPPGDVEALMVLVDQLPMDPLGTGRPALNVRDRDIAAALATLREVAEGKGDWGAAEYRVRAAEAILAHYARD